MSVFAFEAKLGFLNLMALKLQLGNPGLTSSSLPILGSCSFPNRIPKQELGNEQTRYCAYEYALPRWSVGLGIIIYNPLNLLGSDIQAGENLLYLELLSILKISFLLSFRPLSFLFFSLSPRCCPRTAVIEIYILYFGLLSNQNQLVALLEILWFVVTIVS